MAKKGGNPQNLVNFKKGFDERRNMKGRPKVVPPLDVLLADILGDERDGIEAAKAILMALRAKALKGDIRAAEVLLDRAYGKARQSIELDAHNMPAPIIQILPPSEK